MEERIDILEPMIIPQLGDPNFSSEFTNFCIAISKNIGRLVSIQYAKGEKGSSVYDVPVNIGYDEYNHITRLGATLLNTIFGTNIQPGDTQNMVSTSIEDIAPSIGTQMVFNEFMADQPTGITININIDDENHKAYISQPYIFIDERINALRNIQEDYTIWHDFSIGIYGEGCWEEGQDVDDPNTWTWILRAVAIVPKIYYDDDIHEFCWMVNEQQTGITAQGIKGDTGDTFQIIIAKGHRGNNANTSKIYIDNIQEVDENGHETWRSVDSSNVKPGDLALVFYENPTQDHRNSDPYKNAFIGKVHIDAQNKRYVYIGSDNDDHCDYFESIKARNLWEIMMSINSSIVGTPRGYILPAYPGSPISSPTVNYPEETHMIYSEKTNTDTHGYSKLHIAPVKINDTHGSSNDPDTDHIGDMQVDYNTEVQGSLDVQGVVNMHDNVSVQGAVSVQGVVSIQNNMNVQGDVIAQNVTSLGKPWACKIEDPLLACMSRFKNISFSLSRSYDLYDCTFAYNIEISGILELNIGKLSWFNYGYTPDQIHEETWMFPHKAIADYNANWGVNELVQDYTQSDKQNTRYFNNTQCRNKSKLYDVIKYNIPFQLSKLVKSNQLTEVLDPENIFGFTNVPHNTLWNNPDIPQSKTYDGLYNNDSFKSNIMLRFGINGFNFIDENDNDKHFGAIWKNNADMDNSILSTPGWNDTSSAPQIVDTSVNPNYTRKNCEDFDNGDITTLISNMNSIHPNQSDDELYSITGKLKYDPHGYDIKYKFDLFTRIFERDESTWIDSSSVFNCTKVTYNVELDITPVGYISLYDQYKVPIWNTINVNGEDELSYNEDMHRSLPYNLNPIISRKYSEDFSRDADRTSPFNGKTGKIFNGDDIKSKYIISIFEQYRSSYGTIQPWSMPDMTTFYSEITSKTCIIDDNIKVCPNNINDGFWEMNNIDDEEYYGWKSFDPVPYVIIPFEGYIGNWKVGGVPLYPDKSLDPGQIIIGCGNLKPFATESDPYYPVTLNGLLTYPYTPCVISKQNNINPFGGINDMFEDTIPIDEDASVGHYRGRMMGVTNGIVEGIAFLDNSGN